MENLLGINVIVAGLAGLFALFLTLGVTRYIKRSADDDLFREKVADAKRSEFHDEKDDDEADRKPKGWMEWWAVLYRQTGRTAADETTAGKLAAGLIIVGFLVGFLVFPGGAIGGLLASAGGVGVLYMVFSYEKGKRSKTLDSQLPLLLSTIRAQLQANMTPQQAIIESAEEIPAPLGDELKILRSDLNVNVPLETALSDFANRVKSREIKFLISSIQISVNAGSDLDPQIATIQEIVVQRQRITSKLASAVAQVQPALWVSAIIIPAGFGFSFFSSDANREFWGSLFGLVSIGIIAFLYVGGLFISRKLIKGVENT